jgi:tRNA1Val (adenine37-N6)-methyltransferase
MSTFLFKEFSIRQEYAALKVGTDAMVLGALIDSSKKSSGIDIGTGTGVIAMMVAQKNPAIQIKAIEIDDASCLDVIFNFENGPFSNQLELVHADFLKVNFSEKFDLIFTNPPYYVDALKTQNHRINKAKHASDLNAETLCQKVNLLLSEKGEFWLIWPYYSKEDFITSASKNQLYLKKDITIQGKPGAPVRSVICFSKNRNLESEASVFTIRDEFGDYTEEYKKLTLEFHNRKL